jgi:cytochrome c2
MRTRECKTLRFLHSLEKWMTDPDVLVPGNNMEFHVPKAQERRDLVKFLRQKTNK